MNAFARFLFPENIFLGLYGPTKEQAFAHIAAMLERRHRIGRGLIYDSRWKREQLGSTGLGKGVAIPHAQIKGLIHPMTAFARLDKPIDFDAPDGNSVSEIIVLLVPRNATRDHLQMLAEVAEMLCDERFREQLSAATALRAVKKLFDEY